MILSSSRNHKSQIFISLSILILLLSSCTGQKGNSSSSSNNSSGESKPTVLTGNFLDSAVEGIDFVSGSQHGTTDTSGAFSYEDGETVRFSIGKVLLGEGTGSSTMTPVNLVPDGGLNHQAVINIARFLQTLDADGDPSNGISVSSEIKAALVDSRTQVQFDVATSEFDTTNSVILTTVTAVPLSDGKPRACACHALGSFQFEPFSQPFRKHYQYEWRSAQRSEGLLDA